MIWLHLSVNSEIYKSAIYLIQTALEDEVEALRKSVVNLRSKLQMGLEIEKHLKKVVRDLKNKKVVAIATTGFKNDAKKMVVALEDMERVFVPPQHFICLV
ncbi:hypothetical protein L2E82_38797 [Cichorium intybus]|uniref:Uncharacterized protein n=1 Tax=Cichorium intybus TaxID=13427 RepID=A0ACB9AGU7_CICIN|nr:hypothetical protein L2E82_38797 [Cichorium intybus]